MAVAEASALDGAGVQFELTRYLSDNWVPVIEKDVDGPNALPLRLDGEVPNLGKFAACRRVARTIYMGSAPLMKAAHRGIEDRRVKLGCVMPGESPSVFVDALRRLAAAATYLYQDGPRYWYSTQPTVTKLAEDRTEQLKRDIVVRLLMQGVPESELPAKLQPLEAQLAANEELVEAVVGNALRRQVAFWAGALLLLIGFLYLFSSILLPFAAAQRCTASSQVLYILSS